MGKVLIIDDDVVTCRYLQVMIGKAGHEADFATTLGKGMRVLTEKEYDVVFLDVMMPDGNGLDGLQEIQRRKNGPEVIIITSTGTADGAEIALKNGAWDYLEKPLSPKSGILLQLKRVFEYRKNIRASRQAPRLLRRQKIIGGSKALDQALEQLAQAVTHDSNVLIQGETGTGKEVFARTLHENSARSHRRMVVVDCAALPENLIEATLFGHVKGAFTSADSSAEGLVKQADKGSLFLDEIGELTLALQKTLLRVLQERTFRPVGASTEQHSDFRLIAATNRDLEAMVAKGDFREDLYFRLCTQIIELPPLRRRPDDIEMLVVKHIRSVTEDNHIDHKGFSPDFLEALKAYAWPGNVRELLHTVEQAVFRARDSSIILPQHLPESVRLKAIQSRLKIDRPGGVLQDAGAVQTYIDRQGELPSFSRFREESLNHLEKHYLEQLMVLVDGNLKEAMKVSQLGRTRLYTLLKKHGLSKSSRHGA